MNSVTALLITQPRKGGGCDRCGEITRTHIKIHLKIGEFW